MKRAFTLIELLVVIAIIAILAAILFPVFAQAKVAAKKTVDISNHKQIALGMIMYSIDYDDKLSPVIGLEPGVDPTGIATDGHSITVVPWQKIIQPYLKNWPITINPVSPWQISNPVTSVDPYLNFGGSPNSEGVGLPHYSDYYYAPNGADFQGLLGVGEDPNHDIGNLWGGVTQEADSMTSSQVANPASDAMLTDSDMFDWWLLEFGAPLGEDAFDYCVSWVYGPNVFVTVGPLPLWQDSEGTSYCNGISNTTTGFVVTEYADGHVSAVQFGELIRLKTTPEGESVFYHLWPTDSL